MRVSVCVGNYAKTPYPVPGLGMNAFCMEELCYLLKENAFLLDTSLMNDGIISWIEEECGRKQLARRLYPMVHKKGSLSVFVAEILQDTGFYDGTVIGEVERVLKQGAGLSRIEKRKSQIDYLVKKKKYMLAIREYDRLLNTWQETEKTGAVLPAAECLGAIWHNKGVALAGMMIYEKAAECFQKAYQISGNKEDCLEYLAAMRLLLSEEAYVSLVAEHPEFYGETLELEKKMEAGERLWEEQTEYLQLHRWREMRQAGELQKYEGENDRNMLGLKEAYRSYVSEV